MEPGLSTVAYYAAPGLQPPDEDDRVASSAAHGFVVDVAVVEIDERTGQVHVLDYATVHDAGRLLNPLIVDGQVRGGFAHGAAVALFERMHYDEQGALLTGTFLDYLCPTAPDLPDITIAHHDSPSTLSPLGAKGLGEGNTMSAPAAIGNAVADALGVAEHRAAADPAARLGAAAAMKPAPFLYERPSTVEEAVSLLREHGDEAKVLAGGQSLVPLLNLRLARPEVIVDINRVAGLDRREGGRVGATVRQRALSGIPLVDLAMPYVGHYVTRNRGTVGGSIAHADASAELPLCLLVLAGSVHTSAGRELPAEEFFVSHFTTVARGGRAAARRRPGRTAARSASRSSRCATATSRWQPARARSSCTRARSPTARVGVGAVVDRPTLLELDLVGRAGERRDGARGRCARQHAGRSVRQPARRRPRTCAR